MSSPHRAPPPPGFGAADVWRILLALAAMLALFALFWALRAVITPIFFAFLIAYMLDPLVDRFEARGMPRAVGIVVLLTFALIVISAFLFLLLPGIVRDVAEFARELPGAVRRSVEQWAPVLERYGVPVPHSLDEAFEQLRAENVTAPPPAAPPAAAPAGLAEPCARLLACAAAACASASLIWSSSS